MREIKFRQFLGKYGMYYGIGIVKDGHWLGPPKITFSKNPIMQYTGMKDSKGQEIYEGDVVKFQIGTSEWALMEVRWNLGHWDMHSERPLITEHLSDFFNDVEVIGNIYENPSIKE